MKKPAHTTNTMVLYLTIARPQQEQKGRMKHFIFLIHREVSKVQEIERQSYPALARIYPLFTYFSTAIPTITLLVELFYIFRREKTDDLFLFLSLLTTASLMASALTGYLVHKGIYAIIPYSLIKGTACLLRLVFSKSSLRARLVYMHSIHVPSMEVKP